MEYLQPDLPYFLQVCILEVLFVRQSIGYEVLRAYRGF